MTKEEMSVEFDLLYNNIMSNLAPGLDNYEKSRFLTMAQEAIVREYYNGISPLSNSFEKNEAMREALANLVTSYSKNTSDTYSIDPDAPLLNYITDTNVNITNNDGIRPVIVRNDKIKDYMVRIPNDVLYVILEYVIYKDCDLKCFNNREIAVIPVTHDEAQRTIDNPFRGPNLRRVLRLDFGRENGTGSSYPTDGMNRRAIELLSKYTIYSYTMRYIKKPVPIIIEDIDSTDVPINGRYDACECELSELIHRDIVERAAQIASAVYKGNATNNK